MSHIFSSIKKIALTVCVGLLASWAAASQADGQIYYVIVDKDGNEQLFDQAPVDLSYPPRGEKLSYIDISKGEKNEGVPISAREHAARLNQTRVIIAQKPDVLFTDQERARLEGLSASAKERENQAGWLFDKAASANQRGLFQLLEAQGIVAAGSATNIGSHRTLDSY